MYKSPHSPKKDTLTLCAPLKHHNRKLTSQRRYVRKTVALLALTVTATFFFSINYLLKFLPPPDPIKANTNIENAIYEQRSRLAPVYFEAPENEPRNVEAFLVTLREVINLALKDVDVTQVWQEANSWPSASQLTNISSPTIGRVMFGLRNARITEADIDTRGTQLKLLLTLSGHQQSVFKPKWYPTNKTIEGPVYAGKDRYQSEIVAFYLSILLDKPFVPISVMRTLSLKYDILPVATQRLVTTTFERNNRTCVYGKCFYCRPEDPVCDDELNQLTGAVIFNIKRTFSSYRSPWQRTYKKNKHAPWEEDVEFCKITKNRLHKKRLLDLIDTAIFDFLIQNGDRHHYETFVDSVVWVDNGKGLGNPFVHHMDILAPLYQCCTVRKTTWRSLSNLAGGNLAKYLKLMPDIDDILTEPHLKAMEERLLLIFATVEYCREKKHFFL